MKRLYLKDAIGDDDAMSLQFGETMDQWYFRIDVYLYYKFLHEMSKAVYEHLQSNRPTIGTSIP